MFLDILPQMIFRVEPHRLTRANGVFQRVLMEPVHWVCVLSIRFV